MKTVKNDQMFTDYRTYLSFDMEIINNNGETQRLSKTLWKNQVVKHRRRFM